jgi:hypothetical protein
VAVDVLSEISGTPLEHPMYSPDLSPCNFWAFPTMERELQGTFSRSAWSVIRSALLAKGGISKKRPSLHLHKVLSWSNKVSPRTFQTTLVYTGQVSNISLMLS